MDVEAVFTGAAPGHRLEKMVQTGKTAGAEAVERRRRALSVKTPRDAAAWWSACWRR